MERPILERSKFGLLVGYHMYSATQFSATLRRVIRANANVSAQDAHRQRAFVQRLP